MNASLCANPVADSNSSLLEGLFQLVVSGHTADHEFDVIEHEVYSRLLAAYQDSATPLSLLRAA